MIRYLIAKYVDNLARNEPTNVGVIVYDGTEALARFDGENDDARMDLRRVRQRVTGSASYKSWVTYWRAALKDPSILDSDLRDAPPGDHRVIERLLAPSRDFYLELGGAILLDTDDLPLRETLEDLFRRLVKPPDPPAPQSLKDKSKQAMAAAGVALDDEARFMENWPVDLNVRGKPIKEEVSYVVVNGEARYLQEMPFDPGSERRTRKEAAHCAFLVEHAEWDFDHVAFLYDGADLGTGYRFLELLMQFAPTVNVNDTDKAADKLHTHLALG
ncbi:MAG: hypothetical protein ACR2ML_10815 [Solirubrobacteraceae bacterium]